MFVSYIVSYRLSYFVICVHVTWPTSWIDCFLAGLYSSLLTISGFVRDSSCIALEFEDLSMGVD